MNMSRKGATLCVAIAALAVGAFAASASAATQNFYQLTDQNGNVVPGGKFGENFAATGTVTLSVPAANLTNTCNMSLGGQVFNNLTTATLSAKVPGHTLSDCSDGLPSFAAGSWTVNIPQKQTVTNNFKGTVGGVDSLLYLNPAGTARCEFKGTPKIIWHNNNPAVGTTTIEITTSTLNVFTGTGTFTQNCPISSGTITGSATIAKTSNLTNNLLVTLEAAPPS